MRSLYACLYILTCHHREGRTWKEMSTQWLHPIVTQVYARPGQQHYICQGLFGLLVNMPARLSQCVCVVYSLFHISVICLQWRTTHQFMTYSSSSARTFVQQWVPPVNPDSDSMFCSSPTSQPPSTVRPTLIDAIMLFKVLNSFQGFECQFLFVSLDSFKGFRVVTATKGSRILNDECSSRRFKICPAMWMSRNTWKE